MQAVVHIYPGGLENNIGHTAAHTAHAQGCRHRGITDDGMAFKTGLAIEAVDAQECTVVLQDGRPPGSVVFCGFTGPSP